jgi:2Fe-2S ferredoxin
VRIAVTLPDGTAVTVEARSEWTLKDAMRDFGVDIVAQCGGGCACATCHVHVAPEWYDRLDPPDDEEQAMLEESDTYDPSVSRLSCQIVCKPEIDGLAVELQPEAWAA